MNAPTPLTDIEQAGLDAQRAGVKWWHNPHPSGSALAGRWDYGHTIGRRADALETERKNHPVLTSC